MRRGREEEKPTPGSPPAPSSRPPPQSMAGTGASANASSSAGAGGVGNVGGAAPAVSDSAHESCMSRDDLLAQVRMWRKSSLEGQTRCSVCWSAFLVLLSSQEETGFALPRGGVFEMGMVVLCLTSVCACTTGEKGLCKWVSGHLVCFAVVYEWCIGFFWRERGREKGERGDVFWVLPSACGLCAWL